MTSPTVTSASSDSNPNPSASNRSDMSRTDRLDRLPFSPEHRKLLVGSGVGWALDAMDVGLISFVMVALAKQWQLDPTTLSWIASIGFVGMAIGASVGGLLADRIGRRQVFALTLLVYGVATGASALAGSVAVLMVLRFLVGLGLGAELPVASTLVSEFSPARIRGRMVVALESFWAVGWILAALLGYFVVPANADGWRWALAVGIVPTLYAAVVRFRLPESVRFLERAGRHEEAEAAVRVFEQSAGMAAPTAGDATGSDVTRSDVTGSDVAGSGVSGPVRTGGTGATAATPAAGEGSGPTTERTRRTPAGLWTAAYRTRTLALWVVWFMINLSYYGAFIWLPSLIHAQGYTVVKSFEYTLIITLAQLPGYAVAAWLIEKWGRRSTLTTFLLGSAIAAAAFGVVKGDTGIVAVGCALSFFNLGAWGALYAVSPEIYPTSIRGTGTGAAAAFGRIASMLAPLSVPLLLGWGGQTLVFTVFGGAFAIAAAAALALPDRKGDRLEDA